jgi:NAD+-dependent protein deacetylase sirtuin 2
MRTVPTDIASLARYIVSQDCQSIAILTGAGVSTASGIPDFRSPGGMYDTLRPDLITATNEQRVRMKHDPTQVVSWNMFQENTFPYLEVRRPFILGTKEKKWKATIAHRFMELLYSKTKKLKCVYTQNIDGLDYQCDQIPKLIMIAVHGTIGEAACEGCGNEMNYDEFCTLVRNNIKDIYQQDDNAPTESKPIVCNHCQQPLVKPKTVLFGRQLPTEFFHSVQNDLPNVDLLFIAGTSLVVSPANSVVRAVPSDTIRVVVNKEPVGAELGIAYPESQVVNTRDYFAQGECDDIFLELIVELGWLDDLNIDLLPPESAERVLKARRDTAYQKWF